MAWCGFRKAQNNRHRQQFWVYGFSLDSGETPSFGG
jgi:hypothetical protein